jgi:phage shock protein A
MSDLLKKLNTLARAKMHSALDSAIGSKGEKKIALHNAKQQVEKLHKQVEKATEFKEELEVRIAVLGKEAERMDTKADAAVQSGDDAEARRLLEQLERKQQQIAMTEADLERHKMSIQQMNREIIRLEEALDIALEQQAQAEQAAAAQPSAPSVPQKTPMDKLNAVMEQTQSKISELSDMVGSKKDETEARMELSQEDAKVAKATADAAEEAKKSKIEDDLAARRKRLSKP